MAQGNTRSINQIKRDTEATRAGLTDTVEQLRSTVTDTATEIRDRLRPEAIKAEVSGYIKSRGEEFLNNVTESARRNPMQAVAVGASAAYPLFRIARTIPLPILMIGAGLFFAGSKTGRDLTQRASDLASDLANDSRQRAHDLGDQISQKFSDAKDRAADTLDRVGEAVDNGKEQFRHPGADVTGITREGVEALRNSVHAAAAGVSDRIGDLKDRAAGVAESAAGRVRETAAGAASALQAAAETSQAGQDMLRDVRGRTSDVGSQASQSLRATIENNPILVAGVGLLVGGLIASALPKLEAEDNILGDASAAVKRRAQEAAARGFEGAKGAAGEILTNVAQQAGKEGLTTDGISGSARDVTERLQRVAERAVTTAFDPATTNQENPTGDNHG